jgi:hypothetical protein
MSSRPGITATVKHEADGGVSPNRYIGLITAEIRVHWPPLATPAQIELALREVIRDAQQQISDRLQNP